MAARSPFDVRLLRRIRARCLIRFLPRDRACGPAGWTFARLVGWFGIWWFDIWEFRCQRHDSAMVSNE